MLKNKKKLVAIVVSLCTVFVVVEATAKKSEPPVFIAESTLTIIEDENNPVPLAEVPTGGSAPVSKGTNPTASGSTVYSSDKAVIDVSNAKKGYVMAASTKDTKKALKVLVTGPSKTVYTYNIKSSVNGVAKYEVFPLSDGNGQYTVGVYENVEGTKYATILTQSINVSLENEFAPFLLANQYVNYTPNSAAVAKAKELTKDGKTDLEKITAVYNYVVKTVAYDKNKAATVQSGYLPNIDSVLASKKGICFDYAAVMTAMLRSQGVPCKLVVGYAGTTYHAWINTYTKENGWVDNVIMFDGKSWKLMDPTFAASGQNSEAALSYIGEGKNYSAKYLY